MSAVVAGAGTRGRRARQELPRPAAMLRLAGRRLAWAAPLVALLSLGVFALAAASPTDAASAFLGANDEFTGGAARDHVERAVAGSHWLHAWWQWVTGLVAGDLGASTSGRAPVADVVTARLPWTLLLMVAGLAVGAAVSVPLALAAALRPHGIVAAALTGGMWALSAVPAFLSAMVLMGLLSLALGWFPAGGLTDPGSPVTTAQVARHLVLPVLAVALSQLPWITLHLHRAMTVQLRTPATDAARLRGVAEWRVLLRHVLPGAAVPTLGIAGARLPEVVAGSVLVEEIFSWPGLGRALVQAALAQDFALLATSTVLLTVLAILGGLLADLGLLAIDPRTDPHAL
ncbi:ABC transporter permease [Isoptericola variabilis]|uniref:ABC-type transporter, integral membrane subunit n=1 Tax=Isoptericola variabilis (strain 225) TaxID=743718 RepID=F6FR39_ISOV2|nr:ABC transporter permease [Isoptericola variabilis]AEG44989.1 ABC-type transporter, integral membrane subunit [Isoptericola variabilis 225]TWH25999.1 peptide/nickel transport system permease protein [Isoptericola variabilis J7]